jgi:hypothetical protein
MLRRCRLAEIRLGRNEWQSGRDSTSYSFERLMLGNSGIALTTFTNAGIENLLVARHSAWHF